MCVRETLSVGLVVLRALSCRRRGVWCGTYKIFRNPPEYAVCVLLHFRLFSEVRSTIPTSTFTKKQEQEQVKARSARDSLPSSIRADSVLAWSGVEPDHCDSSNLPCRSTSFSHRRSFAHLPRSPTVALLTTRPRRCARSACGNVDEPPMVLGI